MSTAPISLTPSQDYALRAMIDPSSLPAKAPRVTSSTYGVLLRLRLIASDAETNYRASGSTARFYPYPTAAGRAFILAGR